jgi:hypothetical protein
MTLIKLPVLETNQARKISPMFSITSEENRTEEDPEEVSASSTTFIASHSIPSCHTKAGQ